MNVEEIKKLIKEASKELSWFVLWSVLFFGSLYMMMFAYERFGFE